MSEVTRILDRVHQGDPKAAEELLPLVYEELRKLAAHKMANEAPGQTLQPTALVHEAWPRLVGGEPHDWNSRGHFFAAAAELVKLRCFVGISMPEAAEALNLPLRNVERLWAYARAWLRREIGTALDGA